LPLDGARIAGGSAGRDETGATALRGEIAAKPGYLENMTLYAFAPAGLAVDSTCVGKEWDARWQESERTRTFRYRILSVDDDRARIAVTGTDGRYLTG